MKAIAGATVIDGTGRAPMRDMTVLIDGNQILSVVPSGGSELPPSTSIIDASGMYVIPGFLDANVHLYAGITPDLLLEYEGRYEELIVEAAQITLRNGVTTVFDTGGPVEPLLAVRDRVNRGEVTASRIFAAGYLVGYPGMLSSENVVGPGAVLAPETVRRINHYYEQGIGPELWWLAPEAIRERVGEYIERFDIDFLKYAACVHATPLITFSEKAQRAIVDEAHDAGLVVQAHTMSVESLRMVIEAGVDLLTHPNITGPAPIPDALLASIVERNLPGSALVPTERYMTWLAKTDPEEKHAFYNSTLDRNGRRMIAAGARLLLNTDGYAFGPRVLGHPFFAASRQNNPPEDPNQLGTGHFLWLEAVTERGMPPMDALLNATRNVAEAYNKVDEVGTLEPGKRADLLLLEADPLADVRNYRRIAQVFKDGMPIDRGSLPAEPQLS